MNTEQEILERKKKFAHIEYEVDKLGRSIGVSRLTSSQQIKVQEMAPTLEGTTTFVDPETGKQFDIPKIAPLIMAASVRRIDDAQFPFPKNRAELNITLDRLDDEGMEAVSIAINKMAAADAAKAKELREAKGEAGDGEGKDASQESGDRIKN